VSYDWWVCELMRQPQALTPPRRPGASEPPARGGLLWARTLAVSDPPAEAGLPAGQLASSAQQNPGSDPSIRGLRLAQVASGAMQNSGAEKRRRFQRGSVTIWGIGLTLIIAAFAGVVIDTWRVFAERQDLSGMADSAAIAAATAIDIAYLNETGEVRLDLAAAEERAAVYLVGQDGWSDEIVPDIEVATDFSSITVVLVKDVDFTLLGPLLPGEDPLRITVTALASPNVVSP
jgi:hypothetical protein